MRGFVRFRWLFYCKIERRSAGASLSIKEKKIYIHSRRYPHAFLFVFLFFFGISSTSRRSDDATYSIYETDYNGGKRFRAL